MSGFSIAWLDLREAADYRARDSNLAKQAAEWLKEEADLTGSEPVVVDLGAGTGSTLRALGAYGTGKCIWRLIDLDGALLDEALRRHGAMTTIEGYQSDLNIVDELPLTGARLVTASALFDLASQHYLEKLVGRITVTRPSQAGNTSTGMYAALSYDGNTSWSPAHPFDTVVLEAFNRDQRGDKGFGPALGPDAARSLQAILQEAGFNVFTGNSPWRLVPGDHVLTRELVRGMTSAVAEGYGLAGAELRTWESFRLAHAASGSCSVGHVDVLALPRPDAD